MSLYQENPQFQSASYFASKNKHEWESLQQDIELWLGLDSLYDRHIKFHIRQFKKLIVSIRSSLLNNSPDNEYLEYESITIAILVAHWNLLRHVASQRTCGSPYRTKILELDVIAARYYDVLVENISPYTNKISKNPPLIHLGNESRISIYQNQPLVLSLPLDVFQEKSISFPAIYHELGHALLLQIPEVMVDIKSYVLSRHRDKSNLKIHIVEIILQWLEEILADIIGVTLGGQKYVESFLNLTSTSKTLNGISSNTHPPILLRPFIHFKVLEYLAEHGNNNISTSEIQLSKNEAERRFQQHESEYFAGISILKFVTWKEVRAEFYYLLDTLFTYSLPSDTGQNKTLGQLLIACSEDLITKRQQWAELEDLESSAFNLVAWMNEQDGEAGLDETALRLPSSLFKISHMPMLISHGLLDRVACHVFGDQKACERLNS